MHPLQPVADGLDASTTASPASAPAVAGDAPRVSVMVLTRNRLDVLRSCVRSVLAQRFQEFELLILDDGSDDGDTASIVADEFADGRIRPFRSEVPLGVAGGRNHLMDRARGDFVVSLDDDAVFTRDDCLGGVCRCFDAEPQLGILAFRIDNVVNGERTPLVPFRRATFQRRPEILSRRALVSSYRGGGHAIRISLIGRLGGYRGDMMFGGEEMDLAYRAIQAGYTIAYEPSITVDHFPMPSVVGGNRRRSGSELFYLVRNRAYLAYRYLPWRYVVPYLGTWMAYHGLCSLREGRIADFVRAVITTPRYLRGVERRAVSGAALSYLKQNGGRLWS